MVDKKEILRYLKKKHIKLIFLFQMTLIFYLLFGIGILSIIAGDPIVEGIFWFNSGALFVILAIIGFRQLNYERKIAGIIFLIMDVLFLLLGVLMVYFCLGTELWIQSILGAVYLFSSLVSLRSLYFSNIREILSSQNQNEGFSELAKKIAALISIILLVNSVFSFFGYGTTITIKSTKNDMKISFWSGTWNASEYSHPLLSKLKKYDSELHFFISDDLFNNHLSDYNQSLYRFKNYSIEVYLSYDAGGDYIAIHNAQHYKEGVLEIADYLNSENLTNVKGFSADIEWPHYLIHLRDNMMAKGDILTLGRYMTGNINSKAHTEAQKIYEQTNKELNKKGFKSEAVLMWWEQDDYLDADNSLEKLFEFAGVPPTNYDEYNYMIYRNPYSSPYFTYQYVNQLVNRFGGDFLSISLGVVGMGSYESFEELAIDTKICKDLGVQEAVFFLLEGDYGLTGAYDKGIDQIDALFEYINNDEDIIIHYDRSVSFVNKVMVLIDLLI